MADSTADTFAASGLDGERSGRAGFLRGILGWTDPNRGRAARQYMQSMQSAYLAIRAQAGEQPAVIVRDLEAIFARWAAKDANWASADAWADAFACERLMVSLYDPARLEVELERRILEAQNHGLPVAEFYRGRVPQEGTGPEVRVEVQRALLARLIGDLQWYYNQRDLKRGYAHQAQKRVFWTFLVCLLVFLGILYFTFDFAGGAAVIEGMPYGLLIAMVSGLFGASFFMMIELQQRIAAGGVADVRDMWTVPMLLLRCIVGVGAASILYFFFRSGLLEGSLWPDLGELGFQPVARVVDGDGNEIPFLNAGTRVVPNSAFALLIVWGFIAGYSQTLVPNLLLSTEEGIG